MKRDNLYRVLSIFFGISILIFTLGCEREEDDLEPATFPKTAEVFIDGFSAGLEYAAFGDSKLTAFTVDEDESFEGVIGTSSMRFDVPNVGDPEGPFAGGIFRDAGGRDLTEYDALTFYAKASKGVTIGEIGFGVDFEGNFLSVITSLPISTGWQKYIIPIPDAAKLTRQKGLLIFSSGPDATTGEGYSVWLDVVKYEKLGTIAQSRPAILNGDDASTNTFIGAVLPLFGLTKTDNLPNGADITVNVAPSYYEFTSSDTTIAKVDGLNGNVTVVGTGTAVITATLDGQEAAGSLTVISSGEFTPAPIPDEDPADVISIYSNAYDDVPVDFYNGFFAPFQTTLGGDILEINGDNIIKYTLLNFVATEFKNPTVDASQMTHFHVDIQVENPINSGDFLIVQLGDFGPDGSFGGGDDSNGQYRIEEGDLSSNTWLSFDIPLGDFTDPNAGGAPIASVANLAQIFFISDGTNPAIPGTITDILVDNMYFYREGGGGGMPIPPTMAAPTPTQPAADVISIYSDAYTDNPNDGFNLYGAAAFEEVSIMGDGALKYTFVDVGGGNFQVIELGGNQIDAAAAGMETFHFDAWFPNSVDASTAFLMKIVDIPGSGATEAQINVNNTSNPVMAQGQWLSFDIPISDLTSNGLGGTSNIQQVVIDLLNSGEVYLDNIFFYKGSGGGGPVPPTNPAPTPTEPAADVISIYSDAYTDNPRDGFNFYGAAAFEEVSIMGDGALKYTFVDVGGGNFQVIELGGNQIDAGGSGMTNFRFDAWFPNAVDASTAFLLKVVDIPGSGATEAQVNVNNTSSPAMAQGQWLSFDIPISDLEAGGLGGTNNIQQVVIDLLNSGEVYLDNIYFYKAGGGSGPVPPTDPAPTPTEAAADVISIYSDAYTDNPRDGFNFYGAAAFEEVSIMGDGALKYTFVDVGGGNFQVIELGGNQIDAGAAGMTNFRFDAWFPNTVDASTAFLLKVVDIPGSGATEAQINVNNTSSPAMAQGQWLSFDIPISDLQAGGLGGTNNIQQIVVDLLNSGEVYLDNIYFYKSGGGGGGGGGGGTSILSLTFDDAASVTDWFGVADANGAPASEANIDWNATGGVDGGALQLTASNPSDAAGKAYIFQLDASSLNYDGATEVTLTFDLKLDAPLTASAFHLQTIIPGIGVTNNFDLQAQGINESTYTSFSFDFSTVDPGANIFTIHFNFAAGAVENAGGVMLVDNIELVKKN